MARNRYALPIDVLRRFDPTLTQSEVDAGALGQGGIEDIRGRLDEVETTVERKTEHAWRETRVGLGTESYEYHSADLRRFQGGFKVYLDHRHVLPIDPATGDHIEIRSGRDTWLDVTAGQADWNLDNVLGIVQVWGIRSVPHRVPQFSDRNFRISYRFGALGGERTRGGETQLATALAIGGQTIDVENAARLPPDGVMVIDGEEYVSVDRVDPETNTVTVGRRGIRGTTDSAHDAGATLHYCPMHVRSGVAAKTAIELVHYDTHVENLMETREAATYRDRVEEWRREWDELLNKEAEVRSV